MRRETVGPESAASAIVSEDIVDLIEGNVIVAELVNDATERRGIAISARTEEKAIARVRRKGACISEVMSNDGQRLGFGRWERAIGSGSDGTRAAGTVGSDGKQRSAR
jgi:hypothetical protein